MDRFDPQRDDDLPQDDLPPEPPETDRDGDGRKEPPYEPSGLQVRPWVRFLARHIDMALFLFFAGPLLVIINPSFLPQVDPENMTVASPRPEDTIFYALILILYVFFEPLMLSRWGTTPGKAFLKVRLRNRDGSRLDYGTALSRSWEVWIRGLGFGLPVVSWITLLVANFRLTTRGITSWDESGDYTVSHQIIGPIRSLILAAILFMVFYAIAMMTVPPG